MKKFIKKLLITSLLIIIVIVSFVLILGFSYYSKTLKEQPFLSRVEEINKMEHYVTFEQLPQNYINAVIATEDSRFYDHGPIDFKGIIRALYTNIRDGKFDEGGSTISQQVAKNIILNQDKTLIRKIAEIFAATDLEKNYSKNEIFALYVNSAYFGDGYYGIYEASKGYYNKEPKDLTLDESSMLAGIPNAPSVYSPSVNPDLSKKRQEHVLNRMKECGYLE